jgi:hypothetical protein
MEGYFDEKGQLFFDIDLIVSDKAKLPKFSKFRKFKLS